VRACMMMAAAAAAALGSVNSHSSTIMSHINIVANRLARSEETIYRPGRMGGAVLSILARLRSGAPCMAG